MQKKLYSEKPIFEVKKKHAWRGKFIRGVEIAALVLVVLGTIAWLLLSSNFSPNKLFANLANVLKQKIASEEAKKKLSKIEQLNWQLKEKKLFEVKSVEETAEGDFQVKSAKDQVVFFSREKNFDEQVSTLQTLLAKAKIEGKGFKKADFRFSKVVVEY